MILDTAGPAGPAGAKGATGAQGPQGEKGERGERGTDSPFADGSLAPNATLTGVYGAPSDTGGGPGTMSDGGLAYAPVSFEIPLDSAPSYVQVPPPSTLGIGQGGYGSDTGCPGVVGGVPRADSGTFCVYSYSVKGFGSVTPWADVAAIDPSTTAGSAGVAPTGAMLSLSCTAPTGAQVCYARGLWAVTG